MLRTQATTELRARAIDALQRGVPIGSVAIAFGVDRTTLFRWSRRFAVTGQAGLERKPGSGRPRKLQGVTVDAIRKLVLSPASKHGFRSELWTVGRLRIAMMNRLNVRLSQDTIWRRLREAGMTYQKSAGEYQNRKVNRVLESEWLKTTVPRIREAVKKFKAILYFQGESSVSLTGFLSNTRTSCRRTINVKPPGRRSDVSALSATNQGGKFVFRLLEGRISSGQLIAFLKQLLALHPSRHLVIVMGRTRSTISRSMKRFLDAQPRLHVFYLPPYSYDRDSESKGLDLVKTQGQKIDHAPHPGELRAVASNKPRSMVNRRAYTHAIQFRCHVASFFS
jgi:transposase